VGVDALKTLIDDMYEGGKATISWSTSLDGIEKNTARLLLNLAMLAVQAVPRGGDVVISANESAGTTTISLAATGPRSRLDTAVEKTLAGKAPEDGFDGRTIQPFYAGMIARELKGSVEARDFVTWTMKAMDVLLSDARLNVDLAKSTLTDVKRDAKTLHARGISRAAQSVLECYETSGSQPKIDGRLMSLYKLVIQYSEGLAKKAEPQISFESLMPDVTNSALRAARTQGKSISVSYAADGLSVANSQVESVRGQLEDIVMRLVKTRIASPDKRAAKGLPRGGHIDISAKNTPSGLDISVQCDGETVTLFPKPIKKETPPAEDVTIDMEMEMGA